MMSESNSPPFPPPLWAAFSRAVLLRLAALASPKEFVDGAVEQIGQFRQYSTRWTP